MAYEFVDVPDCSGSCTWESYGNPVPMVTGTGGNMLLGRTQMCITCGTVRILKLRLPSELP